MGIEQRKQHRIAVALEIRVCGTDRYGLPIDETITSANISRGGCSVQILQEAEVGAELEVEILRRVPGRAETVPFMTRGEVVRVTRGEDDLYMLGIRFTGPQFPTYSSESTGSEE
ncbi:MAG: PilZ domain-containing protein [Acidobacteria bacterium]|nr:PilZ domain-containing protein [Acidobacteriota bacterium]